MCPVACGIEGLDEGRMEGLDFLQRLGVLKLEVSQAELHLKLGLNEVLPWLSQFNIFRVNLQRPEDRGRIVGLKDGAMVGDDHLRAAILRESDKQELQYRGEILVRRGHPCHNLARIPLQ